MSANNFTRSVGELLASEGKYVDHPRDPGGATNMGITHITLADWRGEPVTKQDVRDLSRLEAKNIYRAKYWNKIRGDDLPDGFDYLTFDGAVNSGPSRGVKWLQKGVGAISDGKMGPATVRAAHKSNLDGIARACAARMGFLQGLKTFGTFGRGWSKRVAHVEVVSTAMWVEANVGSVSARNVLLNIIDEAPAKAQKQIKRATAEATGTGVVGTGGLAGLDLSNSSTAVVILGVVVVISLIAVARLRKANYQNDLAAAAALIRREIQ